MFQWRFPRGPLLLLTLCLTACSGTPQERTAPDYSALAPGDLLALYLDTVTPAENLRFRFSSEVETEAETHERVQGVCGYSACGSLRMRLLGALGVTLLDYVNAQGTATLVINKMTDEGDDAAREGLLQLLRILTLALVDRCHSAEEFVLDHADEDRVRFLVPSPAGVELGFTLDRRSGRLLGQTISGPGLPDASIAYGEYRMVDGRWLPGRLEIRVADQPRAVTLAVERWTLDKPFPAGFFRAD